MPDSNKFDEIVDTFQFINDWDTRYHFLVELGKGLQKLDVIHQIDENLVQGCMSKVWIAAELDEVEPRVLHFLGDCDTATIKGLVAVLIALYSGNTPQAVQDIDADQVFEKLGLYDHLSPHRHVGVYAIVEKIKEISRRFDSEHLDKTLHQPQQTAVQTVAN
jgi:cysteine desulfuration protein SufE